MLQKLGTDHRYWSACYRRAPLSLKHMVILLSYNFRGVVQSVHTWQMLMMSLVHGSLQSMKLAVNRSTGTLKLWYGVSFRDRMTEQQSMCRPVPK